MKAHDYNSTGRVREIAVQFVQERQIYRGTLSVGLFNVEPLPAYQPTLKYVAVLSNNKAMQARNKYIHDSS